MRLENFKRIITQDFRNAVLVFTSKINPTDEMIICFVIIAGHGPLSVDVLFCRLITVPIIRTSKIYSIFYLVEFYTNQIF